MISLASIRKSTKAFSLHSFNTLREILIIFDRHIYQDKTVCRVQECFMFVDISLEGSKKGKFCELYNYHIFEIFPSRAGYIISLDLFI